jgi:fucose permease
VLRPDRRSPLLVQCVTYLGFSMPIGMLGAGWPDARNLFDASSGSLGLVAGGYGMGRLATSAVALPILRRWTIRQASVVLGIGLAASCAAVAITRSFAVLVVAMALIGLLTGCLDSLGNRYQSVVRDVGSAGLMFGSYGVGSTLGPALVATTSWTVGYLAAAAVIATAALLAASRAVDWPDALQTPEAPVHERAPVHVPVGALVLSLSVFAIYPGIEVVTANWAASYLEGDRGVSATVAGLAMSGFWAGMTLGRLSLGRISAMGGGIPTGRLLVLAGTGVAVLYGLLPLVPAPVAVGGLALAGVALAGMFPMLMSTTADRVGVAAAGRVTGWQLLTGNVAATTLSSAVGLGVARIGDGVPGVALAILAIGGLPILVRSQRVHAEPEDPVVTADTC